MCVCVCVCVCVHMWVYIYICIYRLLRKTGNNFLIIVFSLISPILEKNLINLNFHD